MSDEETTDEDRVENLEKRVTRLEKVIEDMIKDEI